MSDLEGSGEVILSGGRAKKTQNVDLNDLEINYNKQF